MQTKTYRALSFIKGNMDFLETKLEFFSKIGSWKFSHDRVLVAREGAQKCRQG